MEFRTPTVSPLRQRMLDDMRMRKLQPRTQAGYIRAVRRFTIFLERAPDTATAEDLRRFETECGRIVSSAFDRKENSVRWPWLEAFKRDLKDD